MLVIGCWCCYIIELQTKKKNTKKFGFSIQNAMLTFSYHHKQANCTQINFNQLHIQQKFLQQFWLQMSIVERAILISNGRVPRVGMRERGRIGCLWWHDSISLSISFQMITWFLAHFIIKVMDIDLKREFFSNRFVNFSIW